MRSMLRLSAATSSAKSVSGSGAATALMRWAASPVMARAQLVPSAHPPWANTTLTSFIAIMFLSFPVSASPRSTQRLHPAGNGPPDFVRRIFLDEMDPLDCHFGLRRKASGLFENLAAG